MQETGWLWAVFTLIAAASQTARNAMQRELTTTLGTVGATHVRFLFGFPFALLSLAGVLMATGAPLPRLTWAYWPWIALGAGAQLAATILMLAAMSDRSFVVIYAYIKTEPVQVALFGLIFLGDVVTPAMAAAILVATAGVVLMALKPGTALGLRATLLGLAAGGMFALSALAAVAFVQVESRVAAPLVDLKLLRNVTLVGSTIAILIGAGTINALGYLLSIYFQNPQVLNMSPLEAGLATLPMTIGLVAVTPFVTRLAVKFGTRQTVSLGFIVTGAGFVALAFVQESWEYLYFVVRGDRRHAFSETYEEHTAAVKDLKERISREH